jgi:hypothetical protein
MCDSSPTTFKNSLATCKISILWEKSKPDHIINLTFITPILPMDPLTSAVITVSSIIVTKALEKTGEKVGENVWEKMGKFLTFLKQVSPQTVTAIEKAPEEPLDYGKAILEVESVVKTSPELSQIMSELVKAIEAEPSFKELVNNTVKSQSQQASVINNQKLADSIKNVFQGNTFFGATF